MIIHYILNNSIKEGQSKKKEQKKKQQHSSKLKLRINHKILKIIYMHA